MTVRGIPVTDGRGIGLLLGERHPDHLPGVLIDQAAIVRLDGIPHEYRAWPDVDPRHVQVTGAWTGRSIRVSTTEDRGAVLPLRPMELGDGPSGELATALTDLQDMRVLVGISMRLTGSIRTAAATATNVRMARDALEPYFDELVVRRALHTTAELETLSLQVRKITPRGIMSGFGWSTRDDGACRATASVQRVTAEMAAALIDVPDTALDLTVLLSPTEPRDRRTAPTP